MSELEILPGPNCPEINEELNEALRCIVSDLIQRPMSPKKIVEERAMIRLSQEGTQGIFQCTNCKGFIIESE